MAPRQRLPALLALLILAAALAPLAPPAGAQGGSTSGSIALSTGAAAYPPGGAVLFTLHNQGGFNVTTGEFQVFAQAGLVATLAPLDGAVAPGARASFDWKAVVNGAAAPPGDYWGILKVTEHRVLCSYSGQCYTTPFTFSVYVNGKAQGSGSAGWVLSAQAGSSPAPPPGQAPPPPPGGAGRLVVGVEPRVAAPGQAVKVVLSNAGTADLYAAPCDIGYEVRLEGSPAPAWSTLPGPDQACIQVAQALAPGANVTFTWDQRTTSGPARPGVYVVRGVYGQASAETGLVLHADSTPAQPPPGREPGPRDHAHITVRGPPRAPQPPGATLTFQVQNNGTVALDGELTWRILDANGSLAASGGPLAVRTLPPGGSVAVTWDQRLATGAAAPEGPYMFFATLGQLHAGTAFAILAAPAPPPAPGGPPRESPPPPPPPDRPLVGRIVANASLGASAGLRCYAGDWVSFCLDLEARVLRDFRAGGRVVVEALPLPGEGALAVDARAGAIVVHGGGATLTVYDSPAGSLRLQAPAGVSSVQVRLGEALAARAQAGGRATLQGPGFEALLLVQGGGAVQPAPTGEVRVDLGADGSAGAGAATEVPGTGSAGAGAGFVLRAMPPGAGASAPPPQVTLTDAALVQAALQAALPGAIAGQRVAAEAYIALDGAEVRSSVVPYLAAEVKVRVAEARATALEVVVDVAQPQGRTLVFHLGEGLLVDTRAGFEVLYDGQRIARASSLADVLDPDDDGLAAEYVLVHGSAGAELVVSVPHFSEHVIRVQGLAEVLPSLAPYGAAAGAAVVAAAAAYLVRRSRP